MDQEETTNPEQIPGAPVEPSEPEKVAPIVPDQPLAEVKEPKPVMKFWYVPVILAFFVAIVGGAIFIANQRFFAPKPSPSPSPLPSPSPVDTSITDLEEQGTSDEIEAIETDLNATDLTNIDKELDEIENELSTP